MQVIINNKRRRSIATFVFMLLVSLFIIFHYYVYQPFTNFTICPQVQWNVKPELTTRPNPVVNITCNQSNARYDLCSINGPTLLDPKTSTLYGLNHGNLSTSQQPTPSVKIKPYPRKTDKGAMSVITEFALMPSAPPELRCDVTHDSPALLFSAGGYTGNFFHDINEGIIPLFVTVNSLFSNGDIILVVADGRGRWTDKYAEPLSSLSDHPIVDLRTQKSIHCFPSAVVGLITHGTMTVDPKLLPNPKTLVDFRTFLKNSYKQSGVIVDHNPIKSKKKVRPRMVIVVRQEREGRAILNQEQVIKEAKRIGFDVTLLDPPKNKLSESYKIIESSHAMLGVHGAGLTHEVFLRPKSVLIQVVPIATEWASKNCYEDSGKALGLEYIEYKIEANESSLLEMYGKDSLVIRDPKAIVKGKWTNMRVYLRTQNVNLDLVRFGGYLRKAYKKAKKFMEMEG